MGLEPPPYDGRGQQNVAPTGQRGRLRAKGSVAAVEQQRGQGPEGQVHRRYKQDHDGDKHHHGHGAAEELLAGRGDDFAQLRDDLPNEQEDGPENPVFLATSAFGPERGFS